MDRMDNHSLDMTELLGRINMQAKLVGGPCENAPVLLPPMLYGQPPEFVCATRPYDLTSYHYTHREGLTYDYADHCTTYAPWPHHPWDPDLSNKSRERKLFGALGLVICGFSIIGVAMLASFLAGVLA